MSASKPCDESVVDAMCAALAPYAWRRFTPELLARVALAALDRRRLETALAAMEGAAIGRWNRLEPAERDDVRVAPLADFLTNHRWTELRLPALCRVLASVS
ncbi:MAG: hypothetical protein ACXWDI_07075 [Nocardioides sp.]